MMGMTFQFGMARHVMLSLAPRQLALLKYHPGYSSAWVVEAKSAARNTAPHTIRLMGYLSFLSGIRRWFTRRLTTREVNL